MLVSFAEEKTGECVVCCHRCGAFLIDRKSTHPQFRRQHPGPFRGGHHPAHVHAGPGIFH